MKYHRTYASACFIFSGIASISYQLLWLRSALSYFGVITPVISVLLSVFMFGLMVGTYAAGKAIKRLTLKQVLLVYALVELCIAASAVTVPFAFDAGYTALLGYGSVDSSSYLLLTSLITFAALLVPCILIGATMPLMMKALEKTSADQKNFGLLYLANLIGALLGCILPLVLIEAYGFQGALYLTTLLNLAACAVAVAFANALKHMPATQQDRLTPETTAQGPIAKKYKLFLFVSGFAAMGGELLWVKAFMPVVTSSVYAFAVILVIYLLGNIYGNRAYLSKKPDENPFKKLMFLPFSALLVVPLSSWWFMHHASAFSLLGIVPISYLFGYFTPQMIDLAARRNPEVAARAYIYNFAGCVLGPLCIGYLIFPMIGLKLSLIAIAALLMIAVLPLLAALPKPKKVMLGANFACCVAASFFVKNYEDVAQRDGMLHRDNIGYIAAFGKGMEKHLTVNGIGMTSLTTITKNMVHLPAAYHTASPPKDILLICMGMGTALRSAASWPFDSITMVELSRGVTQSFPYFYADAERIVSDQRIQIVVDDGRRFLLRNKQKYDIITLDPPPPIDASGSGLLYSSDFIGVIADRLNEGGILAHWTPEPQHIFLTSKILQAIQKHFAYIRLYQGVEGWGLQILASNSPIPDMTAEEYIAKLPPSARQDLLEFEGSKPVEALVANSLHEVSMDTFKLSPADAARPPISDNWLYNEFYLLRANGLLSRD